MRLAKNYPKRSLFRILKKKVYATVFSRKEIMYNMIHRVLGGLSTYPKNIRTLKNAFFGVKPYGEQHLLKAFCPLWEGLANLFEKKPFGLLNKVLEGK